MQNNRELPIPAGFVEVGLPGRPLVYNVHRITAIRFDEADGDIVIDDLTLHNSTREDFNDLLVRICKAQLHSPEEIAKSLDKYVQVPISTLHLSTRTYNCLTSAGVNSVNHLVSFTPQELLSVDGISHLLLGEIIEALQRANRALSGELLECDAKALAKAERDKLSRQQTTTRRTT